MLLPLTAWCLYFQIEGKLLYHICLYHICLCYFLRLPGVSTSRLKVSYCITSVCYFVWLPGVSTSRLKVSYCITSVCATSSVSCLSVLLPLTAWCLYFQIEGKLLYHICLYYFLWLPDVSTFRLKVSCCITSVCATSSVSRLSVLLPLAAWCLYFQTEGKLLYHICLCYFL